jgi:hypothetical protein
MVRDFTRFWNPFVENHHHFTAIIGCQQRLSREAQGHHQRQSN